MSVAFIHVRIYCLRNKGLIFRDECYDNSAVGGKQIVRRNLFRCLKKKLLESNFQSVLLLYLSSFLFIFV